ncbi:MAG: GNAT family N-acetyltransferase [Spirochaetes bacterium]|nr:GNAT family N-acetyltransferase [Spirochaetota bacterium]
MERNSPLRIVRLDAEGLDAWLDFFDHRAFADNPEWRHCYCTFYHKPEPGKGAAGPRKSNRNRAIGLIQEGAMSGYLGLDETGRVVAWCNVNDRSAFARLGNSKAERGRVLAIVCFLVEKGWRRRGAAAGLLSHVLDDAEAAGYEAVEAYPSGESRTDAGNYHGHRALYEKFGFEIHEDGGRLVARKALGSRN